MLNERHEEIWLVLCYMCDREYIITKKSVMSTNKKPSQAFYIYGVKKLTNLQCMYYNLHRKLRRVIMSPMNKLSKEKIIDTAFQFADEHGLENMSMRKLSKELHVKAMSLYNHIDNKEHLVQELIDKLVGLIEFEICATWQETMKARARSMKDILLKHSWGAIPLISGWNVLDNFLQFFETSIGVLVESGFTYGEADQIVSTLNSYVYGYVLNVLHFPIEEENYQASAEEHENFFDKNVYPYLWGLSNEIRLGHYSGIIDFELGLDIVITGIENTIHKGEL